MTNGTSQGLFVIVAVIIFGIFVLISYMLFGDKLKTNLGAIFDTSMEHSLENLTGETGVHLKNQEEGDSFIFAKIREGVGDKSGISDVWVQLEKHPDKTATIIWGSGIKQERGRYSEAFTKSIKGGNLVIPSTINGYRITEISDNAFRYATFNGTLTIPNLRVIGESSFYDSRFLEGFNAPNVETIGYGAFSNSGFSGNFYSPKLKTIGAVAFRYSKFTGDFIQPYLETIEHNAFNTSLFDGEFNVPNVKTLTSETFYRSKFKTISAPNLVSVDKNALGTSSGYYQIK